jgi:2-iminobutanoate/2-iminopropanoate deaminase
MVVSRSVFNRETVAMPINRVTAPSVKEPPAGTWSNCLVVDGIAYVAGMTSRSATFDGVDGKDAYEQTKIVFGKIKALVEATGGSMADIVKVVIYVTDINTREGVWKGRKEFFSGNFPVSTLIEISRLADPRMLVEIDAVAHIGKSRS